MRNPTREAPFVEVLDTDGDDALWLSAKEQDAKLRNFNLFTPLYVVPKVPLMARVRAFLKDKW